MSSPAGTSIPSDLWLVEAMRAQLAQVFNNLLINAQKASMAEKSAQAIERPR